MINGLCKRTMVYVELPCDVGKPYRWGMPFSYCASNGSIVRFMQSLIPEDKTLVIPACDGHAETDSSTPPVHWYDYNFVSTTIGIQELNTIQPDVIGILCSRNHSSPREVLMPLDDGTFDHGLPTISSIQWNDRIPKLFWRGGASGTPCIRADMVMRFKDHPSMDMRLVGHYGTRGYPESLFADNVAPPVFCQSKYILVIDGILISSSHQWVFGSGSVPVVITHPANHFWFKQYLIPYVNYVPISPSMNELESVVTWLQENDDQAKQIADNAMKLAAQIFTPSFQRDYLTREVLRAISVSKP
jgi:hypothetical protein